MVRPVLTLVIVATSAAVLCASIKFTSTWKSMDAGTVSFAGKKVAALVISDDESLRVAGEESLVRELKARGIQGVASYRIAPKEELRSAETAKGWFERGGIEGVVALRPVSADRRTSYTPGTWVTSNYSSLWGYYGYGWSSVFVPGSVQKETIVVVETTVFSVPRNALLWAAVSEARNPAALQEFVGELVKESVKVLQEQGLARRMPR